MLRWSALLDARTTTGIIEDSSESHDNLSNLPSRPHDDRPSRLLLVDTVPSSVYTPLNLKELGEHNMRKEDRCPKSRAQLSAVSAGIECIKHRRLLDIVLLLPCASRYDERSLAGTITFGTTCTRKTAENRVEKTNSIVGLYVSISSGSAE